MLLLVLNIGLELLISNELNYDLILENSIVHIFCIGLIVVCLGAEKALFIRDVPEMGIQNISLNNMIVQAKKELKSGRFSHSDLKIPG